jgi:hypothetical protein
MNHPELKPAAAQPLPNMKNPTNTMPQRRSFPKAEPAGFQRSRPKGPQNAQRNYEHYLGLARAESLNGDRITAENYFQHAEHYLRSMSDNAN